MSEEFDNVNEGDSVDGHDEAREQSEPTAATDSSASSSLVVSMRHGLNDTPLRSIPTAHGEQIRKLRTELLIRHGYHNAAPLVLAVVSTSARDGRSLLATELAMSFAQLGRSTLLIDADMRTPRDRRIYGRELEQGLAQALASGEPPELNSVENYPTLSILGAGDEAEYNPTELLSSKRFQWLIDSTRNLFDFIVIDTPPFTAYSDAQVIAAVVGKVLTLHRAPVNTLKEAREMLDSLTRSSAEVVGAVLNTN